MNPIERFLLSLTGLADRGELSRGQAGSPTGGMLGMLLHPGLTPGGGGGFVAGGPANGATREQLVNYQANRGQAQPDPWAGMREVAAQPDPMQTASAAAPQQQAMAADPYLAWQRGMDSSEPMPSQGRPMAGAGGNARMAGGSGQDRLQGAPSGGSGGGIGGLLGQLFNPGGQGRNRTVQWLTEQGMDPGTATVVANDRDMLRSFIGSRMKGNDPMDALQQEKMRLEIEGMRNPKPEFITGRDGSIFQAGPEGLKQVYGGKPAQPTDVQEYEYAKGQGYAGTFQQFQLEQKRAGASQVNIDQKAEGAFEKKLAEGQAELFNTMSAEGMNARADLGVIGELEGLLQGTGGTMTGLSGYLAKYGIGGEGIDDLQAAQALINKLVPTQRQPGSGTMSDRDVELFTRSLPSLWNTPGGNETIIRTMRGLAQYKQAQGEIADMLLTGEISRQEARKMLRDLPNPLEQFRNAPSKLPTQPQERGPLAVPPPQAAPAPGVSPPSGVMDWRDWLAPGRRR